VRTCHFVGGPIVGGLPSPARGLGRRRHGQ
jgi:hypothetical protein